jgi:hypothetical protein
VRVEFRLMKTLLFFIICVLCVLSALSLECEAPLMAKGGLAIIRLHPIQKGICGEGLQLSHSLVSR